MSWVGVATAAAIVAGATTTAVGIYGAVSRPEVKSPVTARTRVSEIETKLIPELTTKISKTTDAKKIADYNLQLQDLKDEAGVLKQQIDELHAQATGKIAGVTNAPNSQGATAAAKKSLVTLPVAALAIGGTIAIGVGVYAVTRRKKRS